VLENAGHQVLTMNTEREAVREAAALDTLLEHRVSGILLATSAGSTAEPRIPTVFFDHVVPDRGVANVARANAAGVALLVEHLAGHGHTRVAYIGGPATFTSGLERLAGFRDAVGRLGLDGRAQYVELGDAVWSPQSGAAAMERMLALGAMSACRAAGLRLPDDVALASFDDPAFGELLDPPVTALTRMDAEMGRLAASLLLHALESGATGPPTDVRLPGELLIRRSCGCA